MNQRQLEVQRSLNSDEARVLRELRQVYTQASKDCATKIQELSMRTDMENLQSIIYQKQYQEALKKQIDGILNTLQSNSFTTIADYLGKSYEEAFLGTLYDLQGQGIPLIFPINQEEVVQALQTDSKLSNGLYNRMGEDVNKLKTSVRAELSRGVAVGMSYNQIAAKIAMGMNSPFQKAMNRTMNIARTEGHRVQQESTFHCQQKAKSRGADVVKQWDSTLDGATRPEHVELDGQVREVDEPFEVAGMKAMYPGDFGVAAQDCNCRCCLLQRARWALSKEEFFDKWNGDKNELVKIQAKTYNEFKKEVKGTLRSQSEIAGVPKGKPMSFEQADSGHVNPLYGTNGGYSINCQTCVGVFEARQRGYDVQATPNRKGSMNEKLSYDQKLMWIDPKTGEHPVDYVRDKNATSPKKYLQFMKETVQQGERYTFGFSWKGRSRSGHIVNLDKTDDGQLRIKDNQRGNGEKSEWIGDKEVLTYLDRIKYTTTSYGYKIPIVPRMLRIDNLDFDLDMANAILKGVVQK